MAPQLWLLLIVAALLSHQTVVARSAWFRPVFMQPEVQQSQLNCIYQDKKGFIWIGTGSAVFKYDGNGYHLLEVPGNFSSSGVTALFEDTSDRLWIGYENGTVLHHDGFGIFDSIDLNLSGIPSRITSFVEDKQGVLWIGTYGNGVFARNDNGIVKWNTENGLTDDYVYDMTADAEGRIWLGTDNGINILDPSMAPLQVISLTIDDGLPDFIVQSLQADRQGNIWIGMYEKGICRYDIAEKVFVVPTGLDDWQFGAVRDMVIMNDRIWVSTARRGILEYMTFNQEINFFEHCGNISLNRVHSILFDREGNTWLLTSSEICLSYGNRMATFDHFGSVSLNNIHALTIDREDRIWFANDSGLFSYSPYADQADRKPQHHPLNLDLEMQKIMSLYRDDFGFVWVGTFGRGLIRLDPNTGREQVLTEENGLVNGNVLSIAGNEKEIWFGTLGGASRCTLDEHMADMAHIPLFDNFGRDQGLVNNYIYQVYLANDGTPYFATDGNGVQVYREGTFTNILPEGDFSEEVVYSVNADDSGKAWLNIAGESLYSIDGTGLKKISSGAGLANITFSGILYNRNELVIAYNEGIDVLNVQTGSMRHFKENAGISDIDPDLNTLAGDSHGSVWIGSAKGIIKYQPQDAGTWEHPMTNLTGAALFLEAFDYRSKNVFSHNENHLSFSFAGLWYQYPEQVEYVFKLEGHDLDWIRTRNNQVVYSNLRPGTYTFRVKAGIYNNYSVANEVNYTFQIKNPYYTSVWFYLFLALLLGAVVALIISQRVKQVKRKEEVIQEKIRFQFENLKSQINPHFLFNSFSTLIALIEDDSREAVSYVEDLSMLFRNILEYKD